MNNHNTVGVDAIERDPSFNFLSKFTAEMDEDSILTSNNMNASPYNETDISCIYADFDQLSICIYNNDFFIATINIQSLQAKYFQLVEWAESLDRINRCPAVCKIENYSL